jgi:hypothetical protein
MSHEGMPDRQWWKEAVVYEVYPRSFNDSEGDVRQTDGLTSSFTPIRGRSTTSGS